MRVIAKFDFGGRVSALLDLMSQKNENPKLNKDSKKTRLI